MDISRVNETRLVNYVGFNLARLATNDGIDFERYVISKAIELVSQEFVNTSR